MVSAVSMSSLTRTEVIGFFLARKSIELSNPVVSFPNSKGEGGLDPAPKGLSDDPGCCAIYLVPLIFLLEVVGTAPGFEATGDLILAPFLAINSPFFFQPTNLGGAEIPPPPGGPRAGPGGGPPPGNPPPGSPCGGGN